MKDVDAGPKDPNIPASDLRCCADAAEAVDLLIALYDGAVARIEAQFDAFAKGDREPFENPVYPYLGIEVDKVSGSTTLAFGKVSQPGIWGASITQPALFRRYLIEQINSAVLWTQTLETAHQSGLETYVEVGPGKVLFGLARKTLPKGPKLLHTDDVKQTIKDLTLA